MTDSVIDMPEVYPVWWETDCWNADKKKYMAKVLGSEPYTGRYPDHFNIILKLDAPKTRAGFMKMAVKIELED